MKVPIAIWIGTSIPGAPIWHHCLAVHAIACPGVRIAIRIHDGSVIEVEIVNSISHCGISAVRLQRSPQHVVHRCRADLLSSMEATIHPESFLTLCPLIPCDLNCANLTSLVG